MSSKRKLDCSNVQPMKKTRRSINSEVKHRAPNLYDSKLRNRNLKNKRHNRAGTVSVVCKTKCNKVIRYVSSKKAAWIRDERKALIAEMETVLEPWIATETQRVGQPLSKKVITEKALNIFAGLKKKRGRKYKLVTFCASKSWYLKFMIKGSTQKSGEEEKDLQKTEKQLINNLVQIIKKEGYTSQQIFIFSQTSLYWKQFPISASPFLSCDEKRILKTKGNKKRMMLLLGTNVFGDLKPKPLAVYPSENPTVFTGLNRSTLPVVWHYQKHSLITSNIFENWFTLHFIPEVELYCRENQLQPHAMIILDSSITVPEKLQKDYPYIKILTLPFSTTAVLRHMNLNIIKTFRDNYAHKISVKMLQYISERKKRGKIDFWKTLNIKDAVDVVGESWNEISKHYLNLVWKKQYPEFFVRDKQFNDFYFLISWKMYKLINCFSSLHLEESVMNVDDCSTSLNIGHFLDCVIQEHD